MTDNAGATSTANLVITVTGTNDALVAIADTAAASEDNALTITPATACWATTPTSTTAPR